MALPSPPTLVRRPAADKRCRAPVINNDARGHAAGMAGPPTATRPTRAPITATPEHPCMREPMFPTEHTTWPLRSKRPLTAVILTVPLRVGHTVGYSAVQCISVLMCPTTSSRQVCATCRGACGCLVRPLSLNSSPTLIISTSDLRYKVANYSRKQSVTVKVCGHTRVCVYT